MLRGAVVFTFLCLVPFILCNDYFIGVMRHKEEAITDLDFTPLNNVTTRSPIIFAGGLGGSALEFKKTDVQEPSFQCKKTTDWYQGWIDLTNLVPFVSQPCFLHDIRTFFTNGTTHTVPGFEVRGKDYGGVDGVRYIGTGLIKSKTAYMQPLFDYLTQKIGYTPRQNLRAATVCHY
jgi:hypothetical protein